MVFNYFEKYKRNKAENTIDMLQAMESIANNDPKIFKSITQMLNLPKLKFRSSAIRKNFFKN